jgi:hypothetical protein
VGSRHAGRAGDHRRSRRTGADACVRYLGNKRDFLRYDQALASGGRSRPRSSREHAATYADRLDIGGARWGLDGAEALLTLRAVIANGDFEQYWHFHLEREQQRLYPGVKQGQPNDFGVGCVRAAGQGRQPPNSVRGDRAARARAKAPASRSATDRRPARITILRRARRLSGSGFPSGTSVDIRYVRSAIVPRSFLAAGTGGHGKRFDGCAESWHSGAS